MKLGAPKVTRRLPYEGRQTVNHSMLSADWRTHVKILVVGLLFAGVVAAVGSFSRIGDLDLGTAPLVKAGATTTVSGRLPAIR